MVEVYQQQKLTGASREYSYNEEEEGFADIDLSADNQSQYNPNDKLRNHVGSPKNVKSPLVEDMVQQQKYTHQPYYQSGRHNDHGDHEDDDDHHHHMGNGVSGQENDESSRQKHELQHQQYLNPHSDHHQPAYDDGAVLQMPVHEQGWGKSISSFDSKTRFHFGISILVILCAICAFATRFITGIVILSDGHFVKLAGIIALLSSAFPFISMLLGILAVFSLVKHRLELFRFYSYGIAVTGFYMTVTSIIFSIISYKLGSYFDFVVDLGAIVTYSAVFAIIWMTSRGLIDRMEAERREEWKNAYRSLKMTTSDAMSNNNNNDNSTGMH